MTSVKRRVSLILGFVCLAIAPVRPILLAAPPEEFDSFVLSEAMVTMRDGIKLATDVYRPAHAIKPMDAKFPVLLYRTPYNKKQDRLTKSAAYFARHGYVVVVQDCRGRFASPGEFYPFLNEGTDGYDAIEWAAAQSWSNGKVGTIGGSYLAWDQYHAAMYRPPHLVAMFVVVGGANFYEFGYPGGAPNLHWPFWILTSATTSSLAERNPAAAEPLLQVRKNPGPWLALHPQKRAALFRSFPAHRKMYQDFYDHPTFDDYWRQKGFYTAGYHELMKDVPMFFLSGWYDYFAEGVLDNFSALVRLQKTPKKLMMGPWPHGVGGVECGDASYGSKAATDQDVFALDWFNHWMKGAALETVGTEPVRLFRMGGGGGSRDAGGRLVHGGEWRTASAWPPEDVRLSKYYIHAMAYSARNPPQTRNLPVSSSTPGNRSPRSEVATTLIASRLIAPRTRCVRRTSKAARMPFHSASVPMSCHFLPCR